MVLKLFFLFIRFCVDSNCFRKRRFRRKSNFNGCSKSTKSGKSGRHPFLQLSNFECRDFILTLKFNYGLYIQCIFVDMCIIVVFIIQGFYFKFTPTILISRSYIERQILLKMIFMSNRKYVPLLICLFIKLSCYNFVYKDIVINDESTVMTYQQVNVQSITGFTPFSR